MNSLSNSSKLYAFISAICFMVACQNPEQKKAIDTNFIEAKWKGFTEKWEAMDSKGCASYYLEDGLNIAPEFPVNEGREAIGEFYQFLFDMHQSSKYNHNTLSFEVLGDAVIELGEFSVDWVRNDGSDWNFTAIAMVHWVEVDGNWLIKSLIFNKAPE
jgi:ketosteroid isomerase-like protein